MRFFVNCSVIGVLLLSGCSQGLEPHGIMFNDEEFQRLPKMNRTEIEEAFGKPQHVSTIHPKTVYYMGYQTENFYITPSKVTLWKTIKIVYDDQNKVKSCTPVSLKPQNITPLDEHTPFPELSTNWKSLLGTGNQNGEE